MPDLLIELFSEEIPARMQVRAAEDLKKRMTDGMVEAGLTYGGAQAFSTPRRLVLAVEGLLAASPMVREERKGPKVGAPEKAIEGFLRGAGVAREDLEERDTPKGKVFFATIEKPGRPAADIVAEVLDHTIRNFPWPKSMRWGAGSLRWVRPLHSVLCVLTSEEGTETVPLDIDGVTTSNTTQGHRFMGGASFAVAGFDDYEAKLKRDKVILDAAERADHIWQDATNMAFAAGLEVVEDKGLLAEVSGLVEWPVVLMGEIGEEFLGLPPEVLQTSMKEHQKFFSVKNPNTGRIERFITVSNIETADNGATILAGNRKVLSARLADAKFFWENDLRVAKAGMGEWLEKLDNVTFERQLGTQAARIERIARLARSLAPITGADPEMAEQAARVAKADLSSEMVYEFPELQGLMGRYYAEEAGLPTAVAKACEEHYSPLGPSDDVPEGAVSRAVALADKLDLLTGFWAIDEKPTGSKDPFALRRAALGVIRIILTGDLRLKLDSFIDAHLVLHKIGLNQVKATTGEIDTLEEVIEEISDHGVFGAAFQAVLERLTSDAPDTSDGSLLGAVGSAVPDISADLLGFFHDRLKVHLRDQGLRHDVIDACLELDGGDDLNMLVKRAEALGAFLKTEDGDNLLQGYKRAANILAQAEEKDGVEYSFGADVKFAETDEEKALFSALDTGDTEIEAAMQAENYAAAMGGMARLRAPIDAFFEAVQVNAENEVLRRNRLNLLSRIRRICLRVADLSKLEG
ncbi:glycine--tRNA ligase subunit beta [Alisedimentitalea sp. MJ-SS2]|uniref:glycine--tRNA ligase subunit beta n=1 Tax=Aliisedimentitalea sp. MJ-SS2 TaxID=3049795 RepID=UPI0029157F89|nr:glycine--tRNA ligase subunit beta [Alisedimentitalea sp. MJ-SS2]MDU8926068.1 glycine--tRNA ligase subunit beta [Alisedimentitalea sp. MJ-SS2]